MVGSRAGSWDGKVVGSGDDEVEMGNINKLQYLIIKQLGNINI